MLLRREPTPRAFVNLAQPESSGLQPPPPRCARERSTEAPLLRRQERQRKQLGELLQRAATAMHQSRQELEWLSAHPLWLPTPLAPLFRGLRWEAVDAAYLLAAVLTDQKVLLHSTNTNGRDRARDRGGARRGPCGAHVAGRAGACP